MQRVRVGMTGLASVLLLIGLASAVFSSASKEPPVTAIGASKAEVVANMADMVIANDTATEPLADLGVAPAAPAEADKAASKK